MSSINSISLTGMTNATHFDFMSQISAEAVANDNVNAIASTQVKALEAAFNTEDELFKQLSKSDYTAQIAQADADRDIYYMAIKKYCQTLPKVSNSTFSVSSTKVNECIANYKISVDAQLNQETALLTNFIQDLRSERYADSVGELGLDPIVDLLEEANNKVSAYMSDRSREDKDKVLGALKSARAATDTAYQNLVTIVEAYVLMEGEEAYQEFITMVNQIIKEFKQKVMSSKSSSSSTTDSTAE